MNTHTCGALYETFPADAALSSCRQLEFVHIPKHGSWSNIAENELSVLMVQCVKGRRFETITMLRKAMESWSSLLNRYLLTAFCPKLMF